MVRTVYWFVSSRYQKPEMEKSPFNTSNELASWSAIGMRIHSVPSGVKIRTGAVKHRGVRTEQKARVGY